MKSYIKYYIENNELIIDKLYVSPEERGNKKGYQLLDEAKEKAKEIGINMALCVESDESDDNTFLVNYYRNYGFRSNGDCDELMEYVI